MIDGLDLPAGAAGPVAPALYIAVSLLAALAVAAVSRWLARGLLKMAWLLPRRSRASDERRHTLEGLVSSLITVLAALAAVVACLALFVQAETLVWIVGLFSAAFGLAARGLVADLLAGGGFIFQNTFSIGEKVEFYLGANRVEGSIEAVNMRNTLVRAATGELFTIPNGEIGVVRNFSRASFSAARIRLNVPSEQISATLVLLDDLGQEAVGLLPELRKPWQVISTSETVGACTEITILADAAFGQAAVLRLRLIGLISERLQAAGISIAT